MTELPRTFIAPRSVECAFGEESASVEPMIVVDHNNGRVTLRTVNGERRVGTVKDVAVFTAALERPDLTLIRGEHPFLLVNVKQRLIALAFGPPAVPDAIHVLANVVRFEDGGNAVEMLGNGDDQPNWLLFVADITGPEPPTR